jgi:GNAT superfamily N-acetyltransferase
VTYTFRRATPDDAALLAEHRGNIWREVGEWEAEAVAAQIPVWTAWFRDALANGTYVSWIAEEDGAVIASGSLLIHLTIPRPGSPSDREGRVQSVFVAPYARRRGIAQALMERILGDARSIGLIRLKLHPSEMARPLYAQLGFVDTEEMGLPLIGD